MPLMRCQALLSAALALAFTVCCLPGEAAVASSPANIESDVLHFSYELEHWMDAEKRPCQDFFAYVCGKTVNATQQQTEQRLQQEQQKFERFLASNNTDLLMDAELKVKQFYEACKSARSVEDLKATLLYRTTGGWPAIDDSTLMLRRRRNNTWLSVLGAFHEMGVDYFFEHRVEIKSNKRVVLLEPQKLQRYTTRKFEQLAGEVMQAYAVDEGRARLVALEILNFERSRREVLNNHMDGQTNEYKYATFKTSIFGQALQSDWDAYFKKVIGKTPQPNDTVVVKEQPRMMELFLLLHNTTMTRLLNWLWIDYLMDKTSNDCQTLVQHYFEPIYQHIVERSAIDRTQMAQMYADIGSAYNELLPSTPWIDEMSAQSSKQFLGRVMHLTLNGDAKLDADYADLTATKRNFYRNLEKVQRFRTQQLRQQTSGKRTTGGSGMEVSSAASEFMKIFLTTSALLRQQNLTTPVNYALVGERFAEHMIAAGSSSSTPGAWRSMDSEREFVAFKQCMARQTNTAAVSYNFNDLILKMLAQQQTQHALQRWLTQNGALMKRLDALLAAGRLQLSLQKLYYVGSLLADCRQYGGVEQREFVHSYLRNLPEFTQAFGCRPGDDLYAQRTCKLW